MTRQSVDHMLFEMRRDHWWPLVMTVAVIAVARRAMIGVRFDVGRR